MDLPGAAQREIGEGGGEEGKGEGEKRRRMDRRNRKEKRGGGGVLLPPRVGRCLEPGSGRLDRPDVEKTAPHPLLNLITPHWSF